MPKILCTCGDTIPFHRLDEPNEWMMINAAALYQLPDSARKSEIFPQLTGMLKCPVCGRLWVFWEGFGENPQEYLPITEQP